MRLKELRVVVSLAMGLSVVACGQPINLHRAGVSNLLRGYLTQHCDQQTVTLRAARFGVSTVDAEATAFRTAIASTPGVQTVRTASSPHGRTGTVQFIENGQTVQANWETFVPPQAHIRDRLSVSGCLSVPARVEIVDRSIDEGGKTARVSFRETYRLSTLGKLLLSLGILNDFREFPPEPDFEYVAHLQSNRDGAWSVRSLHQI